ncbi:MAG: hypothetical protein M1840_002016, partial [Geoglossum simile]
MSPTDYRDKNNQWILGPAYPDLRRVGKGRTLNTLRLYMVFITPEETRKTDFSGPHPALFATRDNTSDDKKLSPDAVGTLMELVANENGCMFPQVEDNQSIKNRKLAYFRFVGETTQTEETLGGY